MAFEYNQGNPLAGTTTATGKKTTTTSRVKDMDTAAPAFTGPAKYSPFVPPTPKAPAAPTAPKTPSATAPVITNAPDEFMWRIPSYSGTTSTQPSAGDTTEQKKPEDQQVVAKQDEISKEDKDAFALLKEIFGQYGLEELYGVIEGYMKKGIGPSEAKLLLKNEEAYKTRFKGNELRRSKGLNVLSEAEYLDLENSYSETLKAYGLQNYYGSAATSTDRKNRNLQLANVIGNDISAVEFKDRVSTAVDRVTNADVYTKNAFKQFYNIGESDLVGYFLDPEKALVNLKQKATAAEIGGAALGQKLTASITAAEDLARFGVTREQAIQGYANIADILPTAEKLSSIYSAEKITYGQTEAEQEAFKGLASEQRKRKQLASRETAAFGGAAGTSKTALGKSSGGLI